MAKRTLVGVCRGTVSLVSFALPMTVGFMLFNSSMNPFFAMYLLVALARVCYVLDKGINEYLKDSLPGYQMY